MRPNVWDHVSKVDQTTKTNKPTEEEIAFGIREDLIC